MADILTRILERKQVEVADRRVYQPLADLKARILANPEVRADYEAQAPKFELARELIIARTRAGLTRPSLPSAWGCRSLSWHALRAASAAGSTPCSWRPCASTRTPAGRGW